MKRRVKSAIDPKALIAAVRQGRSIRDYRRDQAVFAQGDPSDAVFFVHRGKVKLTVLSQQGKHAVTALLGPGDFFGEGCLAGQPVRMATATTLTEASIERLAK